MSRDPATRREAITWVLWVFAAGSLANGLWMLADPALWYTDLPADVPDFGPLNEHFVRDLGAVFVTFAVALAWAAERRGARLPLLAVTTLFYVLHAAGHVFDTARGFVDPHHWWVDAPLVYLPAVLLSLLVWRVARTPAAAAPRREPKEVTA